MFLDVSLFLLPLLFLLSVSIFLRSIYLLIFASTITLFVNLIWTTLSYFLLVLYFAFFFLTFLLLLLYPQNYGFKSANRFRFLKGVFLKWITIKTRGRVIRKFWRSLFVGTVNVYNAVYSRVRHKPVGKLWHVNKSASRALTSIVQTAFQETLNVHYERKDLEPVLRARQRRFIVFGTANDESWCRVSVWDYVFHVKNKKEKKNRKTRALRKERD